MKQTKTIIIGASAAGLACAACLKKKNEEFIILEQNDKVAHSWRNHYDRLHLHTNKSSSHLPYLSFPASAAKFPSRKEVISYFEDYQEEMEIRPEFNTQVNKIERQNGSWLVTSSKGVFSSKHVIFCTGYTNIPHKISKPGMESFPGKIIHSSEYKNGMAFEAQHVLVIGFGNSACEIAICLHEHGAKPALSVRSAVNVVPRDILGIPVLQIGIATSNFPPKIVDKLNQGLLRLLVGDIEKYGLRKLPYGPTEQIVKHHQIPLLDIGTMDLIRKGHIRVFGDILKIDGSEIHFEDEKQARFDAIVMGTGWETGLEELIDLSENRWEDIKLKHSNRKQFGNQGLYFCGFYVSPTGMLREIGIEAKVIAEHISQTP